MNHLKQLDRNELAFRRGDLKAQLTLLEQKDNELLRQIHDLETKRLLISNEYFQLDRLLSQIQAEMDR